ncbi:hypothetical protein Hjap01_00702 [Haloarcula japonica]
MGLKGADSVAAEPPRYVVVGRADHPRSGNPGDVSTAGSAMTEERSEPRNWSVSGAFWLLDNTRLQEPQTGTDFLSNRTAKEAPAHVPV